MNNLIKTLAVAAFALAGTFVATTAQASAANFNVYFLVHNDDPTNSMIFSGTMPSTVAGLGTGSIAPGNNDPAAGHATYSDALPASGFTTSVNLTFETVGGGGSGACTFSISVKNDGNLLGYLLHFSVTPGSACTVPADQRSTTGQFTSPTYQLTWHS